MTATACIRASDEDEGRARCRATRARDPANRNPTRRARQQLERVLASVTFRQVDRLKRFLSFIVLEALRGPRRSAQGIRHRRPGLRQGLVLRSARRPDRAGAGAAAARAAGALLPRRRAAPTRSSSSCPRAATRRSSRTARRRRLRAPLDRRRRWPGRTRSRCCRSRITAPAHELDYFCDGLHAGDHSSPGQARSAARAGRAAGRRAWPWATATSTPATSRCC